MGDGPLTVSLPVPLLIFRFRALSRALVPGGDGIHRGALFYR